MVEPRRAQRLTHLGRPAGGSARPETRAAADLRIGDVRPPAAPTGAWPSRWLTAISGRPRARAMALPAASPHHHPADQTRAPPWPPPRPERRSPTPASAIGRADHRVDHELRHGRGRRSPAPPRRTGAWAATWLSTIEDKRLDRAVRGDGAPPPAAVSSRLVSMPSTVKGLGCECWALPPRSSRQGGAMAIAEPLLSARA